ncbi:hypothetical protein BU17DRAFT_69372 [Hysterangium stoloniferum]|nr:hypothetical protein BU17DRAFT_69372 [Hysterangium stoloniferum]
MWSLGTVGCKRDVLLSKDKKKPGETARLVVGEELGAKVACARRGGGGKKAFALDTVIHVGGVGTMAAAGAPATIETYSAALPSTPNNVPSRTTHTVPPSPRLRHDRNVPSPLPLGFRHYNVMLTQISKKYVPSARTQHHTVPEGSNGTSPAPRRGVGPPCPSVHLGGVGLASKLPDVRALASISWVQFSTKTVDLSL